MGVTPGGVVRQRTNTINTVGNESSLFDILCSLQNSTASAQHVQVAPMYRTKKKEVRARFPNPTQFILRLMHSDIGYAQLQHFRHIIKMLRTQHISQFEINEKRKMQTTDCVSISRVTIYIFYGLSNV